MQRHYTFHEYVDGRRHNAYYRNRHLFCGPGNKMVLMTDDCMALFVWRQFINKSGQRGINCAVFHNEGPILSSDLIREADDLAWGKWQDERLYTYVNSKSIRSSNPGYCFKMAGWVECGRSAGGLVILEKWPDTKQTRK
jgi:hypothetical protein